MQDFTSFKAALIFVMSFKNILGECVFPFCKMGTMKLTVKYTAEMELQSFLTQCVVSRNTSCGTFDLREDALQIVRYVPSLFTLSSSSQAKHEATWAHEPGQVSQAKAMLHSCHPFAL